MDTESMSSEEMEKVSKKLTGRKRRPKSSNSTLLMVPLSGEKETSRT